MTITLGLLLGAALAAGVMIVLIGLTPRPPVGPRPHRRARARWAPARRRTLVVTVVAAAAGLLLAVVTGWVVLVLVLPVAGYLWAVNRGRRSETEHITRLEALEEWTRSLAGLLSAGVGLEQSVIETRRSLPAALHPELDTLITRLQSRWSTPDALRALADDLADPTADVILANLILAAQVRGPRLSGVLSEISASAAAEVSARRSIHAARSGPRTTARIVTIIVPLTLVVLSVTGDYVAPYATPLGQVVLVVLLTVYALVAVAFHRMARSRPSPRLWDTAMEVSR